MRTLRTAAFPSFWRETWWRAAELSGRPSILPPTATRRDVRYWAGRFGGQEAMLRCSMFQLVLRARRATRDLAQYSTTSVPPVRERRALNRASSVPMWRQHIHAAPAAPPLTLPFILAAPPAS